MRWNAPRRSSAFPRLDPARGLLSLPPLASKGRRESRALDAPALPCAKACYTRCTRIYRYSRDIPAFPAQWVYGLCRALPGERPFLPPLPTGRFPIDVAPGSRRQNHTISPYAGSVSSGEDHLTPARVHRSPCRRHVTMRSVPFSRARDGRTNTSDLRNSQAEFTI